jgi:hypothetical protein
MRSSPQPLQRALSSAHQLHRTASSSAPSSSPQSAEDSGRYNETRHASRCTPCPSHPLQCALSPAHRTCIKRSTRPVARDAIARHYGVRWQSAAATPFWEGAERRGGGIRFDSRNLRAARRAPPAHPKAASSLRSAAALQMLRTSISRKVSTRLATCERGKRRKPSFADKHVPKCNFGTRKMSTRLAYSG